MSLNTYIILFIFLSKLGKKLGRVGAHPPSPTTIKNKTPTKLKKKQQKTKNQTLACVIFVEGQTLSRRCKSLNLLPYMLNESSDQYFSACNLSSSFTGFSLYEDSPWFCISAVIGDTINTTVPVLESVCHKWGYLTT